MSSNYTFCFNRIDFVVILYLLDWNIYRTYFSLKLQNNYSSNLSKISVMSLAMFAVAISGLKQVSEEFNETSYVKFILLYKR